MNTLEIDIPLKKLGDLNLATATTTTTCDGCNHAIGSYDCLATYMDEGYASSQKHFCGMGCMASYIDQRDEHDGIVHDYSDEEKGEHGQASARYISTKKRNHLKSHQFIDEKRRSFPIENCTDVKAAVHAWGRYKGSMSFEAFKAKLSRKAHELGCSLPESWTEKK